MMSPTFEIFINTLEFAFPCHAEKNRKKYKNAFDITEYPHLLADDFLRRFLCYTMHKLLMTLQI